MEAHNSRSFVDAVKGFHGRAEDRQQLQLGSTDEGKMTEFGEEKMVVNPRITGAKGGGGGGIFRWASLRR